MKENTNVDYIEKKNTNVGTGSHMNQIESKLPTRPRRTNQLWKNELGISQIITIQPQQRQHPLFIEPPNSVFSFVHKDTVSLYVSLFLLGGEEVKWEWEEWWVMWQIIGGKDGREIIAYGVQLQYLYVACA
jgi:hypothetical protein